MKIGEARVGGADVRRFKWTLAITMLVATTSACAADVDDPVYAAGVLRYCERFAVAVPARLLKSLEASYVPGSARVGRTRLDGVVTHVSNVFQPADSRFAAMWQCTFSIALRDQRCDGKVALPIAEHAAFADYTSWPRLMIVDDHRRIMSADGATLGYATPKYFETSCPGEGGTG